MYLRPQAPRQRGAAAARGRGRSRLGAFTDAPRGARRRRARAARRRPGGSSALETGDGALERLLARLGPGTHGRADAGRSSPGRELEFRAWKARTSATASSTRCSSGSIGFTAELRALNRRLDSGENLAPLVHQIGQLNDSLQALAYAALGQQGPSVRRRRAG